MKAISILIVLLFLGPLTISCSKDHDDPSESTEPTEQLPDFPIATYAVGYESDGVKKIAKIWKNGEATSLTNGANDASANSIFVAGEDVYVAGYENNGERDVAVLWKNGVKTPLSDGSRPAYLTSVVVSGNDVYSSGIEIFPISNGERYLARVWKNGIATSLNENKDNAWATAVFVEGNDVYVSGYEEDPVTKLFVAKIWKNGIATPLTHNGDGSRASGVFISNGDIYAVGSQYKNGENVAYIWKNNVPTQLSNGATSAYTTSVFVSGNEVYAVGTVNELDHKRTATLWKNNFPIKPLSLEGVDATANSVYVLENDVYVGGSQDTFATIWKNGEVTRLTNGSTTAQVNGLYIIKN